MTEEWKIQWRKRLRWQLQNFYRWFRCKIGLHRWYWSDVIGVISETFTIIDGWCAYCGKSISLKYYHGYHAILRSIDDEEYEILWNKSNAGEFKLPKALH